MMPVRCERSRKECARRILRRGALMLAMLPWLSACGTAVLYQDAGAPNLHFRATSNGRFLSFTAVHLDIRRVTAECRAEYAGSLNLWAPIPLRPPADAAHLPEERLSELVFRFHTHGGGSESLTSYATLLRPRTGHAYEAMVHYDAGLYDVEIREIGPNGAPGRKIEHRPLSECRRA
jgi:hypothetical protein